MGSAAFLMSGEVSTHYLGETLKDLGLAMAKISVERRLSRLRHASKLIASVQREELESLSLALKISNDVVR